MNEPTFSICIPNYNYGDYIGDTIQSVLDQTYPHFEIIVADNASTDHSVEVVERFDDPRIRLIRNRYNIGFAPNLQRATMDAQNDYINLLSSDDQMHPDALETYARAIMAQPADRREQIVLFADAEHFDNSDRVHLITCKAADGFYLDQKLPDPAAFAPVEPQIFDGRAMLADSLGRLKNPMPFLTVVYARALWAAVEGYNGIRTVGPDKHFNYKLLAQNPTVIYVPRPLYRYRDHPSPNRVAQVATIKQQIDDYLYTVEWRDADLQHLGLTRQQLIDTLLDRVCLTDGLRHISAGNYTHALRLFAFTFASYPGRAVRQRKLYALLGLLLLGPLARFVAAPLYERVRQQRGSRSASLSRQGVSSS